MHHQPVTMRGRHPLLRYFGLAFGISWTGVLLSQAQHNPIMWFVAMLLGPATSSLLLTALNDLVDAIPDARGNPVISWEHHVERIDGGGSRVLVRERVGRSWPHHLPATLAAPLGRVHHRWLESRHLRDIKRRVEAF